MRRLVLTAALLSSVGVGVFLLAASNSRPTRVGDADCELVMPTDAKSIGKGQLEKIASDDYPATFGGLWLTSGERQIVIAFTYNAEARARQLAGGFRGRQEICAVEVEESLASLRARLAEVRRDLRANEETRCGTPPGQSAVNLNVPKNLIEITVESSKLTSRIRSCLSKRYGEGVVILGGSVGSPS